LNLYINNFIKKIFNTARVLNGGVFVTKFSFIVLLSLHGVLLSGNLFAAAGDTISNTATVNY